ncbi:MAG: IclR family transcriptional regulator [Gammaproteobacteria bacterium]|nr:IclR family transcriptional regulator [Gammaproteobacteria bacterium]
MTSEAKNTTQSKEQVDYPESISKLDKYSVPALESGLNILEVLSLEIGLSLTDIASKIGKTKTSVFRMLAVLRKTEYVEYSEKYRLYRLSHKMFKISHQHAPVNDIITVAAPIMLELSEEVSESCYLSLFSQGGVLVILREESPRLNNCLLVKVGSDGPLINNCAGNIILTFANDIERAEMIVASKFIRNEIIKKDDEFDQMLERVSMQGYDILPHPFLTGVTDVGYPIFNQLNHLVGVLMVSSLSYKANETSFKMDILIKNVGAAALEISSSLGYCSKNNE